jgi:hypothetical protein
VTFLWPLARDQSCHTYLMSGYFGSVNYLSALESTPSTTRTFRQRRPQSASIGADNTAGFCRRLGQHIAVTRQREFERGS